MRGNTIIPSRARRSYLQIVNLRSSYLPHVLERRSFKKARADKCLDFIGRHSRLTFVMLTHTSGLTFVMFNLCDGVPLCTVLLPVRRGKKDVDLPQPGPHLWGPGTEKNRPDRAQDPTSSSLLRTAVRLDEHASFGTSWNMDRSTLATEALHELRRPWLVRAPASAARTS